MNKWIYRDYFVNFAVLMTVNVPTTLIHTHINPHMRLQAGLKPPDTSAEHTWRAKEEEKQQTEQHILNL